MIRVNKTNLLKLYDQKDILLQQRNDDDSSLGSHVSALTGLIGEDLVLGLFQHYWQKEHAGNTPEVLSYHCSEERPGKRKLDAWLLCKPAKGARTLYQTEIRNWSSYSRGMRKYKEPSDNDAATERWCKLTKGERNEAALGKVGFTPQMHKIEDREYIPGRRVGDLTPKPLLCMWSPEATTKAKTRCFFKAEKPRSLQDVSVFSASLYLRSLPAKLDTICIDAPRVERRLELLRLIMPGTDQN